MGDGVVAVAGPVLHGVALAFVELPVGAQARGLRIHIVHVPVDLLPGADHAPDADLADLAVQHAGHVVGFAVGVADLEHEVLAALLLAKVDVLCLAVVVDGAVELAVNVDGGGPGLGVVGHGHVVPLARLEDLGLVRSRELDLVDRELELLLRPAGVTEAEETVLLDAHDRGDFPVVVAEVVDPDDGLVGQLLQAVDHIGGRAAGIEARHLEVVVTEADRRGDGAGAAHDVADGAGALKHAHASGHAADGDREEVAFVDLKVGQGVEVHGDGLRGSVAGGDDHRGGRKGVVLGVEGGIASAEAGTVEGDQRRVGSDADANVLLGREGEGGGEGAGAGLGHVVEGELVEFLDAGGVDVDHIVERGILGVVPLTACGQQCERGRGGEANEYLIDDKAIHFIEYLDSILRVSVRERCQRGIMPGRNTISRNIIGN